MNTGTKDIQVDIKYVSTTGRGDFGEAVQSVVSRYRSVWAQIIYASGTEKNEGEQVVATNEVHFVINYLPNVIETDLVFYDSKNYEIKHIEVIGRNRELKLRCVKRDNSNVVTS